MPGSEENDQTEVQDDATLEEMIKSSIQAICQWQNFADRIKQLHIFSEKLDRKNKRQFIQNILLSPAIKNLLIDENDDEQKKELFKAVLEEYQKMLYETPPSIHTRVTQLFRKVGVPSNDVTRYSKLLVIHALLNNQKVYLHLAIQLATREGLLKKILTHFAGYFDGDLLTPAAGKAQSSSLIELIKGVNDDGFETRLKRFEDVTKFITDPTERKEFLIALLEKPANYLLKDSNDVGQKSKLFKVVLTEYQIYLNSFNFVQIMLLSDNEQTYIKVALKVTEKLLKDQSLSAADEVQITTQDGLLKTILIHYEGYFNKDLLDDNKQKTNNYTSFSGPGMD